MSEDVALWRRNEFNAHISALRDVVGHFEARKSRAANRLGKMREHQWCFAIAGLEGDFDTFSFEEVGELRRVIEPPGEIELAGALKASEAFSAIARHSRAISFELAINKEFCRNDQSAFNIAWSIISALRVKSLAEFLVPAVADRSWSVIAAIQDQSCITQLLEDVPLARAVNPEKRLSKEDVAWAFEHLPAFINLLEIPKFRLASEALTTHQQLVSLRMMAASLWAGIEALFGIQAELRFRLSLSLACLLEERGSKRSERYRLLKKMYDMRSKAVHGAAMENEVLLSHIRETRALLSEVLLRYVDAGHVLSEEEIEAILLE